MLEGVTLDRQYDEGNGEFCGRRGLMNVVPAATFLGTLWLIYIGEHSLPTQSQQFTAVYISHFFSNLYQPIQIFRYDQRMKTIFIQAGIAEGNALIIEEDGTWKFVL